LDLEEFYSIPDRAKYNNLDFMRIDEIIKIKNKTYPVMGEILNRILTPLLPLLLALLSSVMAFNINPIGRTSSHNIGNTLIYAICAIVAALFFYSLRLMKDGIFGFYVMLIPLALPSAYIAMAIGTNEGKS
jgi:lipopolysaccharide export LptBFGC system permease protein LptF